ncbi:hypothetical protein NIES2101_42585 [Calothrix sp. HK-06]|nr:hypothetical protein NIES2101_42585 [Calothrix sp. HK-06]
MTKNLPAIDDLRESFNRVYDGPDRLQREYDLVVEAERLGMPLDTYRRLYELRGEEHIDPYPKPKKWWHAPGDWGKWVWHLPLKKKLALGKKGIVKLIQSGVIITVIIALGRYMWEAPKREKLAHYQAWQIINSAAGQKTSGGRIEALQYLNKDRVSLGGLDANGANLSGIKLQNAKLWNANLSGANLNDVNFSGVNLNGANLSNATLIRAKLGGAHLNNANLNGAKFVGADLSKTDLGGVNNLNGAIFGCRAEFNNKGEIDKTYCTNLKSAYNITPEKIKKVVDWESACYDPDFCKELGLPSENSNNCAGEHKKYKRSFSALKAIDIKPKRLKG